ncbi:MAG: GNAT family N-acetyltransferase [Syntrophomonas sp.]|nr:GNAT family N-acetyltransferase [Syntrophomonas sp.]
MDGKISLLNYSDMSSIIHLQDLVVKELKDASSYYPLTPDEIELLLGQPGISVGTYNADGDLIGYAAAYFPGKATDNLGLDILLSASDLLQVAHIESGLVHPSCRGKGWQFKLYQELIKIIIKQGEYRYILSTVACNNYPALRNSIRLELLICGLREKYGNKLRYLLMRDLKEPVRICPHPITRCNNTNTELQQQLLVQGYFGYDVENKDGQAVVSYGLKDLKTGRQ